MRDKAQLASLSSYGAPPSAWERSLEHIGSINTQYGFTWGPAEVKRICDGREEGWVTIGLTTPKAELQIYVTKTGKVRIHSADGREWKPEGE